MCKVIALTVFALVPALLWGQFGASLQGTVRDPSGAVIPNAKVALTNNETRQKLTGTTSAEGFYRFTELAPGTYTLTVEAPNFSRQVLTVPVQAEQSQGVNVNLVPGPVTQTVNVTSEPPTLVQTENSEIGGEISTREVSSLPQFGRDPYELLRMTPNTTSDMARAAMAIPCLFPTRPVRAVPTTPSIRPRTWCPYPPMASAFPTTTISSMASA